MTTGQSRILIRWIVPLMGGGVALVILFWLYRGLDYAQLRDTISGSKIEWLCVLVMTILLEQLIRSWKWRQILFDLKPVPTLRLFGAVLAGYGAAVLIPLGISPFVRSWLIARLEGLRMACVLMTAVIERSLDGIVFALIAALIAFLGRIPEIEGNVRAGLMVAGGLNLLLFSGVLYGLFLGRSPLIRDDARLSRWIDWLANKAGHRLAGLRSAVHEGIVWPRDRPRQIGAVTASVAMKIVAATHYLWAGLAVGISLNVPDYFFLMVFAGFALVLARFIRVPGGFVIGSAFALNLLGVPDEQALAMILFNHTLSVVLMVVLGLTFLWRSGIDIRAARLASVDRDEKS